MADEGVDSRNANQGSEGEAKMRGWGRGEAHLSLIVLQLVSLYIRRKKFPFKARHTILVLFQLGLCLVGPF